MTLTIYRAACLFPQHTNAAVFHGHQIQEAQEGNETWLLLPPLMTDFVQISNDQIGETLSYTVSIKVRPMGICEDYAV